MRGYHARHEAFSRLGKVGIIIECGLILRDLGGEVDGFDSALAADLKQRIIEEPHRLGECLKRIVRGRLLVLEIARSPQPAALRSAARQPPPPSRRPRLEEGPLSL